jgi:peptidoglycan/xylan/chitin deacetylase (PgdA/CDA1 family)
MRSFLRRYWQALARRCIGTVTEFRTSEPVAALTFDDGPDDETTPQVLDLLNEYGARATFFMVGEAAKRSPALLKRIAAKGHAIGNHTWSHKSVACLPASERRHQITACARALAPYGQRFFRPPWGEQTVASRLDALLLRHEVIGWSVDAGDWWNPDSQDMATELIAKTKPGSIILMHDKIRSEPAAKGETPVQFSRHAMLKSLEIFLERLNGQTRFVTIEDMFLHGKAVRREWFLKRTPRRRAASHEKVSS